MGRKRELDEIKEKIEQLNRTAKEAALLDEELKTARDALRAELERLNADLQQAYLEKNTISLNMEQISSKLEESAKSFCFDSKRNE